MEGKQVLKACVSGHPRIIFFDGVCNLCTRSVQFILLHDPRGLFSLVSLQSPIAVEILEKYDLHPAELKSFVLLEDEKIYTRSTAALRVARHLNGLWSWLYALIIVPRPLRDFIYDFIAANRFRWFGKKETCWMPTEEWKQRFLT